MDRSRLGEGIVRNRLGVSALIVTTLASLMIRATVAGAQADVPGVCQARIDLAFAMGQEDRAGMETAAASLAASAPAELEAPARKLSEVLAKRGLGAFGTKTAKKALAAIDEYVVANCNFPVIEVEALDYLYDGISKELTAGAYVIQLTNTAPAEHHELVLYRERGSASITVKRFLALDEEGKEAQAVPLGALFAKPDQSDSLVAFLEPGRHVFGCFIDVDTTSGGEHDEGHGDEHGGAAEPHWKEGMRGQFEVVGGE